MNDVSKNDVNTSRDFIMLSRFLRGVVALALNSEIDI